MIKLIASDMDGTLVNSAHTISEENVNVIKRAQDLGIEFIISTGRSYEDARIQVHESGLKCNFLVMNGSELRNSSGEIIQSLYMKKDLVEKVVEKLVHEKLYIELYTTKGIYTITGEKKCRQATATKINFFFPQISLKEAYEDALNHEQYLKVGKIDSLDELWKKGVKVGKIISFSNETDKLTRLRGEIPIELGAETTGSFPINLEITDPKANKGEALKRYAKERNISLENVMTIGDSFNDLSMLVEDFGYTVAMGNAIKEVKEEAKYITETNDKDGVAKVIEKIILVKGDRK